MLGKATIVGVLAGTLGAQFAPQPLSAQPSLPASSVSPGDTETYYEAYYAEMEDGDIARAVALYEQSLSGQLPAELRAQATERLASCREELACSSFARLMPPDPWAYVELDRPGEHLLGLLRGLGLVREDGSPAGDQRLALSPELVEGLVGMRGAALAITGVNPVQGMPSGVMVLHPGDLAVARGLLETVLPAAVPLREPIEGYPTWHVEGQAYVTLTKRLVVVSPKKSDLRQVLRRLAGNDNSEPALADNARLIERISGNGEALLSFVVNPKPMLPLMDMAAQHAPQNEIAMLHTLLDPEHLESLTGQVSVGEHGLGLHLELALEQGHQNLVFNLLRTPALDRRTLERIPHDAAGFLALALNPFDPERNPAPEPAAISGLDLGRELFGNLASVAIFALPPEGAAPSSPIPDAAAVLTVNDPAKSEALWSLCLGLASLAGGGSIEGDTHGIAGRQARVWVLPEGPRIYFASDQNELVLGTSPRALERALEHSSKQSVFADAEYARALAAASEGQHGANHVLLVRPARVWAIARSMSSERERAQLDPLAKLASNTVVGCSLRHSSNRLALHAAVEGLPALGPIIDQRYDEFVRARATRSQGRSDPTEPAPIKLVRRGPDATFEDLFWEHAQHADARHEAIASDLGAAFLDAHGSDPLALSSFARRVLGDAKVCERHLELAHTAAVLANEATGFEDWQALEVLAQAELLRGAPGVAADLVDQALSAVGQSPVPESLVALRLRCSGDQLAR